MKALMISTLVVTIVVVGILVSPAESGLSKPNDLRGWIVYQDGKTQYYDERDWRAIPQVATFTFREEKGDNYVIYGGTFRVIRLSNTKEPDLLTEPEPKSWVVTQKNVSRTYPYNDSWRLDVNPVGVSLKSHRVQVWYYGDFLLEYFEKD